MLKKENRINLNKEFENIFRKGKFSLGRFINLKISGNDLELRRYGIIVSKKISKKATLRNRLKRQLREVLYEEEKKLNKNFNTVIIPQKEILNKNFIEIKEEIKKHFRKNNLY